jgi:iron complex outermembrane receptor protein
MPESSTRAVRLIAGACAIVEWTGASAQERGASLFDLSIEELGQVRVTSVSRRAEALNEAAASVYVITAADIRRSGVASIPEALRLAPGVEVARNGSNEWTISMRGFSSDLSNKLLVLIDGRSVYSPLFAGVFWDVQDALLADIERIEVVAGPGGTLWGANAVNGVINIITKAAPDTAGGLVEAGAGNEETFSGFRYGWAPSETLDMRAYVKHFDRDESELLSGAGAFDDWSVAQAGAALQWRATVDDVVTVHADVYDGEESALLRGDFTLGGPVPRTDIPGEVTVNGHNVLALWRRILSAEANWRLQFYYDHTDRQIPGSFNEARDTYDFDFQHDLANPGRHDLLWGAGLRSTSDDIGNTLFATFVPPSRTDSTVSAYLQDRIELTPERLFLTLGAKLEDNDYTGFESQPNVRVTWFPDDRQTVWAAVSRAVRIPARLNADLQLTAPVAVPGLPLPLYVRVNGNDDFDSEELVAYEAGYRLRMSENLTFDLALFDNYYDDLQTQEGQPLAAIPGPPPYLQITAVQDNLIEGETYGGTLAVNWQPFDRWRLQMHYSYLEMDLRSKPGSNDTGSLNVVGNSPETQIGVHSFIELPLDWSLYAGVRYVEELPNQRVPSYTALDLSLAWEPSDGLRTSLTVRSANDSERLEFGEGRLIERRVFARVHWSF